jgi:DNA-directed RNA polymerase subunit RPC12/RpoP
MTTRFWCARCGRFFEAPSELAGRRVRCLACGHVQVIPEPAGPDGTPVPDPSVSGPSTYALAPLSAPEPASPPDMPPPQPSPHSNRSRRDPSSSWREQLRDLASGAGRLQELSLLLLVLSITDLFMTFTLLRTSQRFYESNPVAMWVFRRWNMAGMTIFKFGAIAVAIALGEVIERRRPGWGKAVLLIGCAGAGVAVWRGLRLYLGFEPMPGVGGD